MRLPNLFRRADKEHPEPPQCDSADASPPAVNKAKGRAVKPGPLFRVLVYGYDDLTPLGQEEPRDGIAIHYDAGDARFDDFDCVILPYRAFLDGVKVVQRRMAPTRYDVYVQDAERDRRDKELEVLLSKGGVVCWLLDEVPRVAPPDKYQKLDWWTKANATAYIRAYPGFVHLYYRAGYALSDPWSSAFSGLHCRRSEFAKWVSSHASTRHNLVLVEPDRSSNARLICAFADGDPAGLAIPVNAGEVLVLPYLPANRPAAEVALAMGELARALRAYRDDVRAAPPPWLDEFSFTQERAVRQELAGLEQAKAEISAKLAPYEHDKRLLYIGDDQLTDHLVGCFEARGVNTEREEKYVEDFFLLDENGNRIAICEVKGLDANLKGKHVSQLNLHRTEHGLDYDFPGVLVANTWRKAQSIEEKDHQIEPKTRKQAAHHHITILRTIDLLRLFDLMEVGSLTREQLVSYLTESPGWLSVDDTGEIKALDQ